MASGSISSPYSRPRRKSSARAAPIPAASRGAPSAPSMTFSSTVKGGTSMKCWCTMPMPARIASLALRIETGRPSIRISPASAS